MKTKKLAIAGTLLLAAVLLLSACGATKRDASDVAGQSGSQLGDPYALYTAAAGKLQASAGYSLHIAAKCDFSEWGDKGAKEVTTDIKANSPYAAGMEMSIAQVCSIGETGQDTTNEKNDFYSKDGTIYFTDEQDGSKYKSPLTIDQTRIVNCLISFSKDDVIDQSATKTAQGSEVKFVIKGDALQYLLRPSDNYGFQDAKNATLAAKINNAGQLSSYTISSFAFSKPNTTSPEDIINEAWNIAVDIQYGHQNIVAPADLDSYDDGGSEYDIASVANPFS
ncbi:MAG: hypothetical protein FWD65_03860 [Coriobacteriia bacterium]|nr:hypothetical protein [Coriobacteriia bacterium]